MVLCVCRLKTSASMDVLQLLEAGTKVMVWLMLALKSYQTLWEIEP